jgi:hypothetical protein
MRCDVTAAFRHILPRQVDGAFEIQGLAQSGDAAGITQCVLVRFNVVA